MKTRNIIIYIIIAYIASFFAIYAIIKFKFLLMPIDFIDQWIYTLIACFYIYSFSIISFESSTKVDKLVIILLQVFDFAIIIISLYYFVWLIFLCLITKSVILMLISKRFNYKYNKGIKIIEKKELTTFFSNNSWANLLMLGSIIDVVLISLPWGFFINEKIDIKFYWIIYIYDFIIILLSYYYKYHKSKTHFSLELKDFLLQIILPSIIILCEIIFYIKAAEIGFEKHLLYILIYSILFDFMFIQRERLSKFLYNANH